MNIHPNGTMMTSGGSQTMDRYELDRLFGMALTDARFFQHLREQPLRAMAQFQLTEPETRAVLDIAPVAASVGELATRLDQWMTHREAQQAAALSKGALIGLDLAAQRFSISNDVLLKMIQEGRIRLSEHDVSEAAVQMISEEYA
jgi:hypothetical protein